MLDLISSDYLDPVCHSNNVEINLKIEVYRINRDWGGVIYDVKESGLNYVQPYYIGTLGGLVTSANLSVDSTSDMRTTGSFSIILEENSIFIPHLENNYYWEEKNLRIIKSYTYPNSNGYTEEFVVGWFVPNEGSYSYNVDTREFSMSCTDLLSYYTESRGGHLSDFWESYSTLDYRNPTDDCFNSDGNAISYPTGGEFPYYKRIANAYYNDLRDVAQYASGIVLEGEKNNTQNDMATSNYFDSISENKEANGIWQGQFKTYKFDNQNPNYIGTVNDLSEPLFTDTNSLVRNLIDDYGHACDYNGAIIDLENGYEMLPYDMEFDADVTLYDVLKKITDLYPNQFIYFDTNRTWNVVQKRRGTVKAHAKDFIGIVTDEHWNIEQSDIKNFTVVWGRDESCLGYYYISNVQYVCENCGKRDDVNMRMSACGYCGGELKFLYFGTNGCSIQTIGTHKQVIYDDNILTDKEACDAARALTYQTCRAKKTLSVTILDRYLGMYSLADIGVGELIEYKSSLTGETGLYIVDKWSNDFESGSVTLELEPYFSYSEDISTHNSDGNYSTILATPEFTFSVENGLLTMIINNGTDTDKSLFKIYYCPSEYRPDGSELIGATTAFYFLGETCTENENGNKIFQYKFKESGTYLITCQAWNPNMLPSAMPNLTAVNVDVVNEPFIPPLSESELQAEDVYISSNGYYFKNENGEYYIKS